MVERRGGIVWLSEQNGRVAGPSGVVEESRRERFWQRGGHDDCGDGLVVAAVDMVRWT